MQPVVIGDVAWEPSPEVIDRSRLKRFIDAHELGSLADLQAKSTDDPEWFWDAVVKDLGVEFSRPYQRVLDTSDGIQWPRWFDGGRMNIYDTCVTKHLQSHADRVAVVWEGEPGEVIELTYQHVDWEVCRFASALTKLGVKQGDAVGLFLPMIPETPIALLACAKIGAVVIPLFSGYGAQAVASRLNDGEAKVLVCADGFYRRGAVVDMKSVADEAARLAPSVKHVVVQRRVGSEVAWSHGRDVVWDQLVEDEPDRFPTAELEPETPLMVIYTSGTTGKPKGALHVHAGFPLKTAQDMAHAFDIDAEDRVFWITDIGWMMGPWLIYGALLLGGSIVIYEGTPDHPSPSRLWEMVERHRPTVLGVSPTLIRSLMRTAPDGPAAHDLSSLRILGGTGEPWNPEPWLWYFEHVGGRRLPIINYSGGTEISGGIVAANVLTPMRPCSFAGPVPGIAADVVDDQGKSVRGEVGELVIRKPWPGMTRGFWHDRERYLSTYWDRFPDVWVHGDWAYIDPRDGLWYILGRSDDTIKVAGKRLGPAEVESLLVSHSDVAEAAAVGVPDELKGEALVCFVALRSGAEPSADLERELKELVAEALGKPLRPQAVNFVRELPRTRNAKILRRVVRSVYLGQEPGDLSALENASSLEGIRAAAAASARS